jgi:hypothetical protein
MSDSFARDLLGRMTLPSVLERLVLMLEGWSVCHFLAKDLKMLKVTSIELNRRSPSHPGRRLLRKAPLMQSLLNGIASAVMLADHSLGV